MDTPKRTKRAGNTASLIYDDLRARILSGELGPGSPISSLSLARIGGTSRGPVREALRRLQQDQLVVARANRRFHVTPFDVKDLEEVLSLHLTNITLAIRVGVAYLGDGDIKQLKQFAVLMDETAESDATSWEAAYRKFVFTLIAPTGHRTLALVGNLIDDIQRYRTVFFADVQLVLRPTGTSFSKVIAAAERRDGATAASTYMEIFGRLSSLILAGAAPRYNASRLREYISAIAGESTGSGSLDQNHASGASGRMA